MNQESGIRNFLRSLHPKIFYLLILLLPIQLGKHFWPKFAFVFGLPIDYLSPTIYLTDILVVGILVSWGFGKIKSPRPRRGEAEGGQISNLKSFFFIFCFLIVSAFLAQSQGVAFYKLIKLLEFFLLGLYIAKTKLDLSLITYHLSLTVIYSSLIAIGQFLKQSSLNGIFWYLGERAFTLSTPGIAKGNFAGRLFLRPYGTFPHPNVLAGFSLISLVLILFDKSKKRGFIFWPSLVLGTIAILLSFSRVIWLVGGGMISFFFLKKARKKKIFVFFPFLLVFLLTLVFLKFPFDSQSISRRLELNQSALLMIKKNLLLGVGLGNFLVQLPNFWQVNERIRFLQPVHNIFLLVGAETGLIGLGVFIWFLFLTFKKLLEISNCPPSACRRRGRGKLGIPLLIILLTGVADHYWLTLQQGQLMFALVLGLTWSKVKK
jgi:O-antigen ligase